uniref:(northern house mosquito) hypothetical protein n=1 Tax=Culex pipiens TaxID=7175 RepID=A0A8D8E013_CULPI
MYMYCRSSTRYCRPQEVSNPRRFIRYHTLPTPNAINLRPFQLPKVTAAVYVLPKSILPPIHSHSTLLSHSLDILLVKVKGSKKLPINSINFQSIQTISTAHHLEHQWELACWVTGEPRRRENA